MNARAEAYSRRFPRGTAHARSLGRVPRALLGSTLLAILVGTGGAVRGQSPDSPLPDPNLAILSTGQTHGYRGNVATLADGNRDDGDLIRGRLRGDYDYADDGLIDTDEENLVVDRATGLMWIRDTSKLVRTDGRGASGNQVLGINMSWNRALGRTNALVYAGYDDWRMPNVAELQSLLDFSRTNPVVDPLAFPNARRIGDYHWTSTTAPHTGGELAYYIMFYDGHSHPWWKSFEREFTVRPVRDAGLPSPPVPIFRTGQTRSYGSGDDGDLQRGVVQVYDYAVEETVDQVAENVLTDPNTGLMWVRDSLHLDGQGGLGGNVLLDEALDWQTAVSRCNDLDYADHADWRLPNVYELLSITQQGREGSVADPEAFPRVGVGETLVDGDVDTGDRWWSSTTTVSQRGNQVPMNAAWFILSQPPLTRHHVEKVTSPSKARRSYVRCVRDAEPRLQPDDHRLEIRSSADWQAMSISSPRPSIERLGKFLLAAPDSADPPFAAAFQDVSRHPLHEDFLRSAYPERFGAMGREDYRALAARRSTRQLFAGGLSEFRTAQGQRVYGFDLYIDPNDPDEQLTEAEVAAVHAQLSQHFRRRPLVYSPTEAVAETRAREWQNPPFPIAFPAKPTDPGYEAYTTGEAYGRLRILSLAELPEAKLSWQDIVVLDQAPTDLDSIVAGILTGGRQAELSHLAVRSARRGTVNAYLADAPATLADYEGQLLRLTVTRQGYWIDDQVSQAEAEDWWASRRPTPIGVPALDREHSGFDSLAEIAAWESAEGRDATERFGAKASGLARLFTFLPAQHQVPGFAIPFQHYLRFMAQNEILDESVDPPERRSLAEQVARLHQEPRFHSDPGYRGQRLAELREAIRDGDVPDALEDDLAARIAEVFGPETMVRFRSSSNAEDGLAFNGAGLYDSTSVCAEDGSDGDGEGPSRCDPNKPDERGIKRGLRRVWASLWNDRAWAERAWYGIDQEAVAMALLVTPAFPDERANGVAFTGNPLLPEAPEMLVNAQAGDLSVVLPEPGVLPERSILEIDERSTEILDIRRLSASTEVPEGELVLSNAELRKLGQLMLLARERYPVDPQGYDPKNIMLDLEFKLRREDDEIVIKQIRPFLAAGAEAGGADPGFLRLQVTEPLRLCAGWREAIHIREEHADQLQFDLPAGDWRIPLDAGAALSDLPPLFETLDAGPELIAAESQGPLGLSLAPVAGRPELRSLQLQRRFEANGRSVDLRLVVPAVHAGEANLQRITASDLIEASSIQAESPRRPIQTFYPCDMAGREHQRLSLEGGLGLPWRADLEIRYGPSPFLLPYAAARLTKAHVHLPEGSQVVTATNRLVYDAGRHNWDERFLVRFEPPLAAEGQSPIHGLLISQTGIAGRPSTSYRADLLRPDLLPLRPLPIDRFSRLWDRARLSLPWLGR